jgi:hypothetical protein
MPQSQAQPTAATLATADDFIRAETDACIRLFVSRSAAEKLRARFPPPTINPSLACVIAAITLLPAAAATGHPHRSHHSHPDAAEAAATNPRDDVQAPAGEADGKHKSRLLTPDQMGHQGFVTGVAEAPLRDLDVVNAKIPPVLKRAMQDPYERPEHDNCREITAQVRSLYDALGPDYDEPTSKEHSGVMSKNSALDVMRIGEAAYIPLDGVIRLVSGATRHHRYVLAAIQAGAMRRAYLKGLGEAHGCNLPGAPDHFARTGAVRREPGFGPYPKPSKAPP